MNPFRRQSHQSLIEPTGDLSTLSDSPRNNSRQYSSETAEMPLIKTIVSGSVQMIELPAGTTRIGRALSCELNLPSPIVSKLHAVIECQRGTCILKNESSKGTIVNGVRLCGETPLKHGDHIQIGLDVLVFHQSHDADLSLSSALVPIREGAPHDPDDSLARIKGEQNDSLSSQNVRDTFRNFKDKICGRLRLRDHASASLASTDSVRKLSQALRLTELLRCSKHTERVPATVSLLFEFFPQATQIVLARAVEPRSGRVHVCWSQNRVGDELATTCEEVLSVSLQKQECLLLVDQWRELPGEKPRLSTMGRISMMTAPILSSDETPDGILQLLGAVPGKEFLICDLERLAILAQLLTIVMPLGCPQAGL